jgi:2-polyprenyl-6-methoxyphenol hydroxylase-like FAD-dependent oxidoreductase
MSYKPIFATSVAPQARRNRGRAVVIGGSMAGMLAARILAEHFDRVTIIERDCYPDGPQPRPGLSQARHLHALLLRGREIFEKLFPGLSDELKSAGAEVVDAAYDLAWYTPGGWGIRFRSGLEMLTFSRDLLDWIVRRRLAAFTGVGFMEGMEATGLLTDAAGQNVIGVSARSRQKEKNARDMAVNIDADLVVDAGGRASKAPQWLCALGYRAPAETVVNSHLGYASRIYARPAGWQADWLGVFSQAAPPKLPRAGLIFPIENNRWIVTLGGGGGDYPPTDEAGFLEFARSLPNPLLYETIRDANPLTGISGNRSTQNRLLHYERLARQPERFIALGDGVCAFNPVYGQGMTNAALGALELDRLLRERSSDDLGGLARDFQRRLAKVNAGCWMLATSEDHRYHGAEGGSPGLTSRVMHWYMDQVIRLSTESIPVRRLFLEVQQMLKPPTAMFGPRMIAQVAGEAFSNLLTSRRPHVPRAWHRP